MGHPYLGSEVIAERAFGEFARRGSIDFGAIQRLKFHGGWESGLCRVHDTKQPYGTRIHNGLG